MKGAPRHRGVTVATIGLIAFSLHWLAIIISVGGPNPIRQRLGPLVDPYTNTLFHQRWRLFAPEPSTYSKKFLFRCRSEDGAWTNWKSPVDDLLEKHYRLRVTHHGKLLRIPIFFVVELGRSVGRMEEEASCKGRRDECAKVARERIKSNPLYHGAMRYTQERCTSEGLATQKSMRSAQFKLELRSARRFAQRNDPNGAPPLTEYEFDPFDLEPHDAQGR